MGYRHPAALLEESEKIMSKSESPAFVPVCESCGTRDATHEVALGGEAFEVCGLCLPHGRGVASRKIGR